MFDWKTVKNDLPEQIVDLCDTGFEFSVLLDSIDEDMGFDSLKQVRLLISSFERLRQKFKTVVFSKAQLMEKIKVPITEYPIEEKEDKKIIVLPIKSYVEKLEKDLQVYYSSTGDSLADSILNPEGKIKLFNQLRSFETYVFDLIDFSKQIFYSEHKPYDYNERLAIKRIVNHVVDWKLEQLNEAAEFILEGGIPREDYSKAIGLFIFNLKSISSNKQIESITSQKIKKNYPFIVALILAIKDKKVRINNENIRNIIPKLYIANEPPFGKQFGNLTEQDITHSFQFPNKEEQQKFWEVFLASTIRRAGLILAVATTTKKSKENGEEMYLE